MTIIRFQFYTIPKCGNIYIYIVPIIQSDQTDPHKYTLTLHRPPYSTDPKHIQIAGRRHRHKSLRHRPRVIELDHVAGQLHLVRVVDICWRLDNVCVRCMMILLAVCFSGHFDRGMSILVHG